MPLDRRLLAAFVSVVVAPSLSVAAPAYVATPLGVFSKHGGTSGNGIDASGRVTGFFVPPDGVLHAFVYEDEVIKDLGTLGGEISMGNAINASGQVVGSADTGDGQQHAFRYTDGAMVDLGTLGGLGGVNYSVALGINALGQVTGFAGVEEHAFIYSNGVMTDLGTLGGRYSHGNGINSAGQVVGLYGTDAPGVGPVSRAFGYSNGVMYDLGTLGGLTSQATAINESGLVTGRASLFDDSGDHAFIYSNGIMHDLGTPGGLGGFSRGMAINSAGDVVGGFNLFSSTVVSERAFVYTGGAMYDLNTAVIGLGGTPLYIATGINDTGQIIANGCSQSGLCQAFRLDPAGSSAVPTKMEAVEFYYAPFDHYFITADAREIAALDAGTFPGWVRTGESFNVYSIADIGTAPVCRFFSTAFSPKSSHFYTPDAGECSFVKSAGGWQFEGIAFATSVPDTSGQCSFEQPVYRLFNNGQGSAPNHRYTTSLATRAAMIANGWTPEGYGPLGVIMCSPQ